MKKLLFLFAILLLFSCSSDAVDNSSNLSDDTNKLYTIELKKIFKAKDNLMNGSFAHRWGYGEQYGTGNKQHRSVDTLIIDFSYEKTTSYTKYYNVVNTDPFDHPYEYIRYIKVIDYTPLKKLRFGDAFIFDADRNNCTSGMIFSAWLNGNGVATDHDAMGYFNSNLSEDEIKSLTDLSSTDGNQPFFKVEPTYENEFLELKMYKQPFDVDFPNGLNVGDLILYDTTIQNCDGDNNIPKHKAEYEVVSISIE